MVKVQAFVCDDPARAFLKCTIAHNGYYGCERCTIKSTWMGRIVFNITDIDNLSPLRTEEQFDAFNYKNHQTSMSPLINAGLSCIKSFTLDYMHLICLGVVKRILSFLKQGPRNCKLSQQQVRVISENLCSLNGKMPREFARQPRSLAELDKWKATEFRQFVLYTGPIVLKPVVSNLMYNHFLTLTVAMSIYLDSIKETRSAYCNYAKELMLYFIKTSTEVYGDTFVTYNVHNLIHIGDDFENFQTSLNDISAFPF